MPRFYFHFFDELHHLDRNGVELPDKESAVALARKNAVLRVAERIREDRLVEPSHRIDIEDDDGAPVATIRMEDVVLSTES